MQKSKVELASREDADWSFVENAKVMKCIKNAAIKATNEFEMVEYEDAEQDALLWLAVRPEMVRKAIGSGDFTQLTQDIYTNALRVPAIRESDRYTANVYMDELDTEEAA